MLDPKRLRTDLDALKAALGRRGLGPSELDRAADLDSRHREVMARAEQLRAQIKTLSKQVGEAHRGGDTVAAENLASQSRALGDQEREVEAQAVALAGELREVMLRLPNPPSPDCPDGDGPDDNVVVRTAGRSIDTFAGQPRRPHWEIGADLGILDMERGAKMSGSMFPMYRGAGARLARALCQYALDRNRDAFEEIRPPSLVRTETMVSTGHLPKFVDEAYHLERDDLWAIPTAEVPLTSLARDEILDESVLPMRLMAHTSCFRREAGSAGRDTRGLIRVHEFDKVEILAYCTPDQAAEVHSDLMARAEGALADLGLAYRVLDLCTGDLGASAARTYDLEVFAPGCDMWLEASSVSWFTDYQARRANVRFRPTGGGGTQIVHTLNGSALAVPRVWAAVVETYLRADGGVDVPEVLRPYFGGEALVGNAIGGMKATDATST